MASVYQTILLTPPLLLLLSEIGVYIVPCICAQKREEEAQKTAAEEFDEFGDDDETVEVKMDIDELVCGALESSFWAMDRLILRDKENYR